MSHRLFCCKCGIEVDKYTTIDGSIVCYPCWDKNDLFCKTQDDEK